MHVTADSIDWNKLWMNAKSACGLSSGSDKSDKIDCATIWDQKEVAKRYDQTVTRDNYARGTERIGRMAIDPDCSVLDVGAGPGSLAIPLAKRVKSVTAIEPGFGMFECLQDHIKEEGIENIVCINKKWEAVSLDDIGKHDVVVASMSLGMVDLKAALRKMNDAANRYVYIFWHIGKSDWWVYYKKLWPIIHNKPYVPGPGANYVYNILYGMEIYANVEIGCPLPWGAVYPTFDDAVTQFKAYIGAVTPEQESALRKHLPEILVQKDNGAYTLPDDGKLPYAMIWWEKEGI